APEHAPLLHHRYQRAQLPTALVVLAAATAAGVLRIGFPHHLATSGHTDLDQRRESTKDARPTGTSP
ncbi:MFS transporter, partial [Streptomyces pseudovenezuelae]